MRKFIAIIVNDIAIDADISQNYPRGMFILRFFRTPTHTEVIKKKKLALLLKSVSVNEEGTYKCRVTRGNVHTDNQFDLKVVSK